MEAGLADTSALAARDRAFPLSPKKTENIPAPVPLIPLQRTLSGSRALVSFRLGETKSYRWTVTDRELSLTRLPSRQELSEMAGRFERAGNRGTIGRLARDDVAHGRLGSMAAGCACRSVASYASKTSTSIRACSSYEAGKETRTDRRCWRSSAERSFGPSSRPSASSASTPPPGMARPAVPGRRWPAAPPRPRRPSSARTRRLRAARAAMRCRTAGTPPACPRHAADV